MSYNTKNYSENGDRLIIGGTLEILYGAIVNGMPKAANQTASVATEVADLVTDFNSLLKKLKAANLMEQD